MGVPLKKMGIERSPSLFKKTGVTLLRDAGDAKLVAKLGKTARL